MVYWQVLNNDPFMVVRCLLSVIEMDISFSELFAYILCGCSFPVDWWLAPISGAVISVAPRGCLAVITAGK